MYAVCEVVVYVYGLNYSHMVVLWPFHGLLSMVFIYHEPPKP